MRKKQGHGPCPTFVPDKIEKRATDEFAWIVQPDPAPRVYDSSLSKPGRFCKNCRTFVAGGIAQCRSCYVTD